MFAMCLKDGHVMNISESYLTTSRRAQNGGHPLAYGRMNDVWFLRVFIMVRVQHVFPRDMV